MFWQQFEENVLKVDRYTVCLEKYKFLWKIEFVWKHKIHMYFFLKVDDMTEFSLKF